MKTKQSGKKWTEENIKTLKKLVKNNTPTPLIAWKMGRTKDSIYAEASKEKISLKPTNKSPYGTTKKKK